MYTECWEQSSNEIFKICFAHPLKREILRGDILFGRGGKKNYLAKIYGRTPTPMQKTSQKLGKQKQKRIPPCWHISIDMVKGENIFLREKYELWATELQNFSQKKLWYTCDAFYNNIPKIRTTQLGVTPSVHSDENKNTCISHFPLKRFQDDRKILNMHNIFVKKY